MKNYGQSFFHKGKQSVLCLAEASSDWSSALSGVIKENGNYSFSAMVTSRLSQEDFFAVLQEKKPDILFFDAGVLEEKDFGFHKTDVSSVAQFSSITKVLFSDSPKDLEASHADADFIFSLPLNQVALRSFLHRQAGGSPRIILADTDKALCDSLARLLKKSGYEVIVVEDGRSALRRSVEIQPELIICGSHLDGINGINLCQILRAGKNTAHIPIILLSTFSDAARVEEALKAGITDYTFKPVDFDELNRKVAYYLGITFGRRRTALIVDDDEIIVKMLRYALFDERFSFICASSGVEALQLAKEYKPDVILTDYLMPGMDGWAFCRHLKTDDVTKDIPIVMISSLSSELDLKKGTVLQVDDYVTKPFTPDMVKRAVNLVLLKKQARLQENRNKELETELSIGRELQKKLMPSADFAIENILQIKSRWLPARHLGGDFYCIFDNHRSEKRVQLLVADVSGKGLGAALLATASQACLRTSVRFTTSPAQLLQQLNAFLLDEQDMETFFVTVFAADIDYGNGILTYASAGHNQMFFRRSSGEIEALHTENLPCGLIHSEVYQELTINMSPGDTLMLYTDGVSEALSPERQVYGEERIRRIMEENSKDFFNILLTDLVNFTGDELQHDDITLIEAAMI